VGSSRTTALICPRLRAPIVLAHGLFGFARIGLGPVTFASYFRGIPDSLRAGGNRVLVTNVHPTAGIARRAERLGEQILAAFPDQPVHLIAHSMGGLDARALLAIAAWPGRVLSLTTIGTPHLGSSMADFAQMRVGRIYRLLEALKIDHRGFLDVTREAAREFDRRTPVPAHIPCFSVAGRPLAEEVSWPLRRLHAILHEVEGPNDGLVSVESALAFGTPLPTWPLDHFRQMDWLVPAAGDVLGCEVRGRYTQVVDNLAQFGFAAPDEADRSQGTVPSTAPGLPAGFDGISISA
jgi:triacylglycerol lipase